MDHIDLYANQQPRVYVQTGIVFPLAVLATILRFVARKCAKVGFWWDDWLLLLASVFNCGQTSLTFIVLHFGLGRHVEVLDASDIPRFMATFYAGTIIYTCVLATVKGAILAFYWRIFGSLRSFRIPLYTLSAVTVGWTISTLAGCIFTCDPIQWGWGDMSDPNGTCINKKAFFLSVAAVNSTLDISILALPIFYVIKLHTRTLAKKLLPCAAFLLGGFVCIVSLIRIFFLSRTNFEDPDQSWLQTNFCIWTGVEVNVAIICACLPVLRPAFRFGSFSLYPTPEQTSEERPDSARHLHRNHNSPTAGQRRCDADHVVFKDMKRTLESQDRTTVEMHDFLAACELGSRTKRDRMEMPSPASDRRSAGYSEV